MKPAPVQPSLFDPPKGDCPMCDGTGTYRYRDRIYTDRWLTTVCPNCGGSGSQTVKF